MQKLLLVYYHSENHATSQIWKILPNMVFPPFGHSRPQSPCLLSRDWRRRGLWGTLRTRHSRPQRPRSFWSAPRIATSGLVQRHSVFEWLCKHNRLRPEPIRFVKLDCEHAQSDGKSVNRRLPLLDLARGRDSWCWPKGARPLGTRMRTRSQNLATRVS